MRKKFIHINPKAMKKYLFMIVAALLSLPIAAQKQQKNNITIHGTAVKKQPNNLYIVDGIKVSKEFWDSIPKEKIKSSNTFENIEQLFIIETKTFIFPSVRLSLIS